LSLGKKQRQHTESPSPSSPEEPAKAPNVPDPTDSEDELPEVAELIKRDATKELKELKQRALEIKYKGPITGDDGNDDDLVIGVDPKVAVKEEEEHRRSGRQARPSTGRRIVELFAHVNPTIKAKKSSVLSPNRVRKDFSAIIQDPLLACSGIDINRIMLKKAQDQASREIKRKEEEWTKHGGHLAQKILAPVEGFECAMKNIAGKGLETVKAKKYNGMDVDEEYGEDTDKDDEWTPDQRVSASPRSVDHDGRAGDITVDEDITMVADEDMDVEDADITKVHQKVFVSDSEEEEENDENAPVKPVNTKDRRSSTLSDISTEDEHNKENDRKLLFEESEDKENMNIVRRSPLSKKFTIFDLTEQGGSSSFEAPSRSQGKVELNGDGGGQRRPFQLLSEESPKSKQFSPSSLTQSFASKLQHASPLSSTLAPAPTLKPFLASGNLTTLGGFSQFSQAEPDVFAAPLQPGFSELFETGTEQRKSQITLKNKNEITADQVSSSSSCYC
jgi:mediator of replication checkpoint protein 1